jgi:hypothetical protein
MALHMRDRLLLLLTLLVLLSSFCYQDKCEEHLGTNDANLSKVFLILRRIRQDVVQNVHRSACKVYSQILAKREFS